MRSTRFWLILAVASGAAGCATIAGLDQYEKGDAEVSTDATIDQSGDVAAKDASNDTTQSDVVTTDVVETDATDGGPIPDATDGSIGDAGDCGVPDTVKDCTMCGAKCDGTNSNNTNCNGTTCTYQCKSGFSNCNTTAPDLNGCECATPACCGASCQTTHMNGIGQNYYDCVDAGTYNQAQALKACTAFTNDQFACQTFSCVSDAGDMMICGPPDAGSCACWTYTGLDTGHVYKSGNSNCFCPDTNDLGWN